jgi:sulfide dehydrogenase [flavocytochrome c] flavoprotein subunit
LIIDANESHSKQKAFQEGWARLYPGMIEWVKGTEGGNITIAKPAEMSVEGEFGEVYKGDVINLIPHQKAGQIVLNAGLATDSGWCEVHQDTFESKVAADVFILGDACMAGAMPKSGHSAASQAKNCAAVIVSRLAGETPPEPTYANTCFSLLAADYGISVVAVYNFQDGEIKRVAGGVSPLDESDEVHLKEAQFARSWFRSITMDAFA